MILNSIIVNNYLQIANKEYKGLYKKDKANSSHINESSHKKASLSRCYPLYFLGITPEQKAECIRKQQEAQNTRKNMPRLIQVLYPVKGKKVGVKAIKKIQDQIKINPLHQDINEKMTKEEEASFLKNISVINRNLTHSISTADKPEYKKAGWEFVAKSIDNSVLRNSLLEKTSVDNEVNNNSQYTVNAYNSSVEQINEFTKKYPYSEIIKKVVGNCGLKNNINLTDVFSPLHLLNITGQDGTEFNKVLQDYDQFINHALKHKENFSTRDNPITEQELDKELNTYIDENNTNILAGIILVGKDAMTAAFDKRKSEFINFIKVVDNFTNNEVLFKKVHTLCKNPQNKEGEKLRNHQKIDLINFVNNYYSVDFDDDEEEEKAFADLVNQLERMEKKGVTDPMDLSKNAVKHICKISGMPEEEINNIPHEKINLWDMRHFLKLQIALNGENSIRETPLLKDLIKATFRGDYWKHITDPSTEVGKANKMTKKAFKENGLDYKKWLNYDKKQTFKHNGKEYEISVWKRNPGHDLFMGHYSGGCMEMGRMGVNIIIHSLLHTLTQYAEIKEKQTGETKGYARCYFTKEGKNKALLIDSLYFKSSGGDAENLIKSVKNFTEAYAKDVANKPVKTYVGTGTLLISKFESDNAKKLNLKLIGESAADNQCYVCSADPLNWTDIQNNSIVEVCRSY